MNTHIYIFFIYSKQFDWKKKISLSLTFQPRRVLTTWSTWSAAPPALIHAPILNDLSFVKSTVWTAVSAPQASSFLINSCLWSQKQQPTYRIWASSMELRAPIFTFFIAASDKHLSFINWGKTSQLIASTHAIFREQERRTANTSRLISTHHLYYSNSLFQNRWNLRIKRLNPSVCIVLLSSA